MGPDDRKPLASQVEDQPLEGVDSPLECRDIPVVGGRRFFELEGFAA
jgi:hypothetical protein